MAIQIDCPGCGEPCAVPEHLFGAEVKCPRCASQFIAPTATPTPLPASAESAAGGSPYEPVIASCPFCGTSEPPKVRKKIHPAGWILFGLLLVPCAPFCWVALFIREQVLTCSVCRRRLG